MDGIFLALSGSCVAWDRPANLTVPAIIDGLSGRQNIIMNNIIKTEIIQNVFVVHILCNKLVNSNTEMFKTAMDEYIEQHRDLLVDMTRVEYIDSSGLGCLLHCLRKVVAVDGRFTIYGVTRPILSLFELIRLDQVFVIHNTMDEALGAFRSNPGH